VWANKRFEVMMQKAKRCVGQRRRWSQCFHSRLPGSSMVWYQVLGFPRDLRVETVTLFGALVKGWEHAETDRKYGRQSRIRYERLLQTADHSCVFFFGSRSDFGKEKGEGRTSEKGKLFLTSWRSKVQMRVCSELSVFISKAKSHLTSWTVSVFYFFPRIPTALRKEDSTSNALHNVRPHMTPFPILLKCCSLLQCMSTVWNYMEIEITNFLNICILFLLFRITNRIA
jgi:hypothetical protein